MQYQMNEFLFAMILTEFEDAVGKENCSTRAIDRVTHSVDYYWLSRMWADRGCRMPIYLFRPRSLRSVLRVKKRQKTPLKSYMRNRTPMLLL